MTETKRPLKVFLCHAHADRDAVRGLYARLTKDGVDRFAVARQRKTPPRAGLGIGNPQGCKITIEEANYLSHDGFSLGSAECVIRLTLLPSLFIIYNSSLPS
jgi:hypothetical protein